MHDSLRKAIASSHRVLRSQLDASADAAHAHLARGEIVRVTDDFLINTCRHISAVCDVVLPVARGGLPSGRQRVRAYVQQARLLERKIAQAKHRLYGEAHAVHVPWSRVWDELGAEFDQLMTLEQALVSDLAPSVGTRGDYSERLAIAGAAGPTRPHPHSLHFGRLSHVSRSFWAKADSFWDTAEGRIVAAPAPKATAA